MKNNIVTISVNGFNVPNWNKSVHLDQKFGAVCLHWSASCSHDWHICDIFWTFCRASSSVERSSDETPPRRQRNDFRASATRFLDTSQAGASGIFREYQRNTKENYWLNINHHQMIDEGIELTKKATQMLRNGTMRQAKATRRHGRSAPRKKTMNVPKVPVTPPIEIKLPRTEASLEKSMTILWRSFCFFYNATNNNTNKCHNKIFFFIRCWGLPNLTDVSHRCTC